MCVVTVAGCTQLGGTSERCTVLYQSGCKHSWCPDSDLWIFVIKTDCTVQRVLTVNMFSFWTLLCICSKTLNIGPQNKTLVSNENRCHWLDMRTIFRLVKRVFCCTGKDSREALTERHRVLSQKHWILMEDMIIFWKQWIQIGQGRVCLGRSENEQSLLQCWGYSGPRWAVMFEAFCCAVRFVNCELATHGLSYNKILEGHTYSNMRARVCVCVRAPRTWTLLNPTFWPQTVYYWRFSQKSPTISVRKFNYSAFIMGRVCFRLTQKITV